MKTTIQIIVLLSLGVLIGLISSYSYFSNKANTLEEQKEVMYKLGTDMGDIGVKYNKMYNLCREENQALLDEDYESVKNLFSEQQAIQREIESLYSKYK